MNHLEPNTMKEKASRKMTTLAQIKQKWTEVSLPKMEGWLQKKSPALFKSYQVSFSLELFKEKVFRLRK